MFDELLDELHEIVDEPLTRYLNKVTGDLDRIPVPWHELGLPA